MYNSLEYVKNMEQVGFTRKQADTTVTFVVETMDQHFASKQDFKDMNSFMEREFKDVRNDFKNVRIEIEIESQKLRTEMMTIQLRLQHSIRELENRLMLKMLLGIPVVLKTLDYFFP